MARGAENRDGEIAVRLGVDGGVPLAGGTEQVLGKGKVTGAAPRAKVGKNSSAAPGPQARQLASVFSVRKDTPSRSQRV
jgi:hypothetical protein